MRKRCLTLVGILVGLAAGAQAALICDLDATVPGSVVTNASGVATDWVDQSGNANNAGDLTRVGDPLFPSASLSVSGLSGVDFTTGNAGYRLFSSAEQDSFLDFTGAASAKSGFAVFAAVKVDSVNAPVVRDPVFGNHGNATILNNFILKYEGGQVRAVMAGQTFSKSGGTPVAAGNTLIIAFNYNKATGAFELWDSNNMSSLNTNAVANGNFSSTQTMWLGRTDNGGQFINGAIGEFLVYDEFLDASAFSNKYTELTDKWAVAAGINTPTGVSAVGSASSAVLDWADDGTGFLDFYTVYRSTISGTNNYVAQTNLSASAYIDTDVTNGTPYFYAVTATDTNGFETTYSDEVSATPIELSPDVVVSFPVTDPVLRNLITVTLDYTVDGAGVVTLDASTSNGGAAPKAVVDAWDGIVGSVSDSAMYNTSFTLTGIAKTNDVATISLSTWADNPGPGLGVKTPLIKDAGAEKIEWTLTSADDVVVNFKSVEYTNRVANGDSNLTFLDEDSREEYVLPNSSSGGSIDLIGEGFSLSVGDTFVVTTDDFKDDGITPRASSAGASLFGFVFEAVPSPPPPGITVTFPNSIPVASGDLNKVDVLTFDFTVDGSGNVTIDASTTAAEATTIAAVDAWDGPAGSVSYTGAYSTAFSMTFSALGNTNTTSNLGVSLSDGGLGVFGKNAWRIDRASSTNMESIAIGLSMAAGGTVDFQNVGWVNRANSTVDMLLSTPSVTQTNNLATSAGTMNLTGVSLLDGQAISFSNPDAGDENDGYTLASFSFDILEPIALVYSDWATGFGLINGPDGDDDNDGLSNLYEFGVGGNPVNGTVAPANMPVSTVVDAGGSSNVIEYVYTRLEPVPSGLTYYLNVSTAGLLFPNWTDGGYTVEGEANAATGFKTVTNQIPVDANTEKFIKLIVEQQ